MASATFICGWEVEQWALNRTPLDKTHGEGHDVDIVTILAITAIFTVNNHNTDDDTTTYTYETRYFCETSGETKVDSIIKRVEAPIYDDEVASGRLQGWGWLKHRTGNQARRLFIETGPSYASLYDAQSKAGGSFSSKYTKERDEFRAICTSHIDDIWRTIAGNYVSESKDLLIANFSCAPGTAPLADAWLKENLATALDEMIESGELQAWSWRTNIIGGYANRSLTLQSDDYLRLLTAWEEVIARRGARAKRKKNFACNVVVSELWYN